MLASMVEREQQKVRRCLMSQSHMSQRHISHFYAGRGEKHAFFGVNMPFIGINRVSVGVNMVSTNIDMISTNVNLASTNANMTSTDVNKRELDEFRIMQAVCQKIGGTGF